VGQVEEKIGNINFCCGSPFEFIDCVLIGKVKSAMCGIFSHAVQGAVYHSKFTMAGW